ncbi:MAG: GTP-binding protein [Deltaproteobacteria bacterium]|nr:GTP-binding protein [Deltaproteobacteria bacterium]
MAAATAVQLITGFLGSGKTTFLNRVIRSFPKDRKLMILMNEFGEVGVDGALVEGEDLDILEISKGSIFCVCVKTDFIKGLNEIARKHQPDVLLMESTGVANPTDLKRDLSLPFFQGRFELTEQFCLLDAANFEEAYEVFASVEKQIASSTVFVLNKTDLATPEQVKRVKELVARHHPNPRFFETTYAEIPVGEFLPGARTPPETDTSAKAELLSAEELKEAIDRLLDDPERELTPPDRLLSAVYAWEGGGAEAFGALAARLPPGIVRGKGFLSEGQDTRLFSLVMGRWSLETATLPPNRADLLSRIVFIAPPEVMPLLERLGEEFPGFRLRALLDPAAGKT